MAPRNPLRAKASDLTDLEALEYSRRFTEDRGVRPSEAPALDGHDLPAKVIREKYRKLTVRGFVLPRGSDGEPFITLAGRVKLDELRIEEGKA